jgi:hypothetical protein
VLESASVVGRVFYRDALAEFPDGDGDALDPGLIALIRKQLIEPARSDIGGYCERYC